MTSCLNLASPYTPNLIVENLIWGFKLKISHIGEISSFIFRQAKLLCKLALHIPPKPVELGGRVLESLTYLYLTTAWSSWRQLKLICEDASQDNSHILQCGQ